MPHAHRTRGTPRLSIITAVPVWSTACRATGRPPLRARYPPPLREPLPTSRDCGRLISQPRRPRAAIPPIPEREQPSAGSRARAAERGRGLRQTPRDRSVQNEPRRPTVEEVGRGGCRLLTGTGQVDLSLETQLGIIQKALEEAVQGEELAEIIGSPCSIRGGVRDISRRALGEPPAFHRRQSGCVGMDVLWHPARRQACGSVRLRSLHFPRRQDCYQEFVSQESAGDLKRYC